MGKVRSTCFPTRWIILFYFSCFIQGTFFLKRYFSLLLIIGAILSNQWDFSVKQAYRDIRALRLFICLLVVWFWIQEVFYSYLNIRQNVSFAGIRVLLTFTLLPPAGNIWHLNLSYIWWKSKSKYQNSILIPTS